MTVVDGEPRCHVGHLFLVSTQKRRFWNTKSKPFFNMHVVDGHF
jgi:hypothetical protein